jgi:bifunctional DNase/RNase
MSIMVEAEIWTVTQMEEGNAVLLKPLGLDLVIPIFIGQAEAQSILFGLGGVTVSRPLTHDLFLAMTHKLQLELFRAEVWDLKDNTFYGRLIYRGENFPEKKPLVLDARPSDIFALAVRSKSPIFIAQKVIDETGLPMDFFLDLSTEFPTEDAPKTGGTSPAAPGTPASATAETESSRQETLLRELEQAVEAEEYELAAKIRDMLSGGESRSGASSTPSPRWDSAEGSGKDPENNF